MPVITSRDKLAARASGGATELVIPEVPQTPISPALARRFPELAEWQERQYKAWSDWRAKTNASIVSVSLKGRTPAP